MELPEVIELQQDLESVHNQEEVIRLLLQTLDQGVIHPPLDRERIRINLKREQIHIRQDQEQALIHRHDRTRIHLQDQAVIQVHLAEVGEDKGNY